MNQVQNNTQEEAASVERSLWTYTPGDMGNAKAVDTVSSPFKYCPELGRGKEGGWFRWNDKVWEGDHNKAHLWQHIEETLWKRYHQANNKGIMGADTAKQAFPDNARILKVIKGLEHKPWRIARFDEFDANPDILNVANGTIDLKTGRLEPHCHSSKICNATRQC